MKILIGTPINEIRDFCMEKWLQNVVKLQKEYPSDLLLVDTSLGLGYVEKVKGYCKKYGITNYKMEHIEILEFQTGDERLGRSREIIRQEVLSGGYDAWFSWESDQIIPPDALNKLVKIMKAGNYMIIHPNSWDKVLPSEPEISFGVCLVTREPLEKYGFLLEYPDMPDSWHGGDVWFKKQVLKAGGSYIEVYGLIKPIYHLTQ